MSHHVTSDETNDRPTRDRPKQLNSGLSSKGGALVLRSVSLFLAGGRKAKQNSQNKKCNKKMKENPGNNGSKQVAKLLETLKRDTHFSKYDW